MQRVDADPWTRRVRPTATKNNGRPHHPLAARFDMGARGFEQYPCVPGKQPGVDGRDLVKAGMHASHLFAGIKHEGEVPSRRFDLAAPAPAARRGRPSCRRCRGRDRSPRRSPPLALPAGGTVSRWPASTILSGRPSAVRATTLLAIRTTSSAGWARSSDSTRSASAASWWLTEAMSTRRPVSNSKW